jgi:hypothetical protein
MAKRASEYPSPARSKTPKKWTEETRLRLQPSEHQQVAPTGRDTKERWEEAAAASSSTVYVGASRLTPKDVPKMEEE